jgi:diguanylate cyclase (GGDEF)-like protein/PAS domain S-box-containing protein
VGHDELIPRKSGHPQVEFGGPGNVAGQRTGDRVLELLAALATMPAGGGKGFFHDCLLLLASAYGVQHAFIATIADVSRSKISTLAAWKNGKPAENFSYELASSPCSDVIAHEQVFIPDGVMAAYPGAVWLQELAVDSYQGVALTAASGEKLGLVVVAGTGPMNKDSRLHQVFELYADRIAHEIENRQSQKGLLLAASVFEQSPQGIMITDAQQRILKVNAAFAKITGWQESEVMGRRESMLSAGRDAPGLRAEIQAALDAGGIWFGELWSRRRDGEVYPESRTVVAVMDEYQQLQHYVSSFSDISAEKFAAERIHRLAHYDATTELPNRVLLQDRLLHAINRVARGGKRLALLFLDLDGFKLINDTYGHSAGDEVLRLVGVRLTSRLRKADIVARIGGDEFAVVVSDVDQGNDVQTICDQLLQVITEPYELSGQTSSVTTSIGIAIFPEDGGDVQTLLKHADAAMYRAKERGKNRYAFYEPEMNQRAEERLHLTRRMRHALEKEEFGLCYQPQYDLASGRLVGVEALVRWKDEDGNLIPPSRFIPVAEDSGLIVPLGNWVLKQACHQAQQWRDQELEFGRLSVNISGRQFNDEGLQAAVAEALAASGLPGERLELEITESWVMEGPYRAEQQMRLLRDMGINLVIDDFGVANSSMAYLKGLPVQKLKIDRSFVRDILSDSDDAAIVSAMIAMGHSLGLRVVAEGVETSEQSAFLRGTGCDEVQGYLFGRPVPSDEMNVLLLYSPTLAPS